MRFFVVRLESAQPAGLTAEREKAYVSCWINSADREAALAKAAALIKEQGWRLLDVVEDYEISRDDYREGTDGLGYYEQALIDDEVLVFFVPEQGR